MSVALPSASRITTPTARIQITLPSSGRSIRIDRVVGRHLAVNDVLEVARRELGHLGICCADMGGPVLLQAIAELLVGRVTMNRNQLQRRVEPARSVERHVPVTSACELERLVAEQIDVAQIRLHAFPFGHVAHGGTGTGAAVLEILQAGEDDLDRKFAAIATHAAQLQGARAHCPRRAFAEVRAPQAHVAGAQCSRHQALDGLTEELSLP